MKRKNKKGRTFFTDIWRKIIALALAFFVWYMINQQISEDYRVYDVPVTLVCKDKQVILPDEMPLVNIRVRTSRDSMQFDAKDFDVELFVNEDENSIHHGGMTLNISNTSKFKVRRKPWFTKVTGFEPLKSQLFLDKLVVKGVPISVKTSGNMGRGLAPQFSLTPEKVILEGPSAVLNNITKIHTETVPLEGVKEDMKYQLELENLGSQVVVSGKDLQDGKVQAHLKVVKARDIQTVMWEKLPVRVIYGTPQLFKVDVNTPLTVKVTISADQNTINELKNLELRPYVDLASIAHEGEANDVPVQLDLPEKLTDKILKIEKSPLDFNLKLVPIK